MFAVVLSELLSADFKELCFGGVLRRNDRRLIERSELSIKKDDRKLLDRDFFSFDFNVVCSPLLSAGGFWSLDDCT